jgi:hypothetical protein
MKLIYKILIGIVIIGIFLISIFLALSSKKQVASPIAAPPISGPTLTVPAKGGSLPVSDFTKHPTSRVLGDTTVIKQNDNYSIVYFSVDQSFLITILAEPVQANREAAEQEFLNNLQISQADACKLTVSLAVPAGVSEALAGQNYGLSFCPNGQVFPVQ